MWPSNPADHHLRALENIPTNFSNYRPSLADQRLGIRDTKAKWDFHLQKLEELGVVQHRTLVFSNVPYTSESSRRLFRSASENFPKVVMWTGKYHATNDPGYGVTPFVLEVCDFPSNMPHWSSWFQTNNYGPP